MSNIVAAAGAGWVVADQSDIGLALLGIAWVVLVLLFVAGLVAGLNRWPLLGQSILPRTVLVAGCAAWGATGSTDDLWTGVQAG